MTTRTDGAPWNKILGIANAVMTAYLINSATAIEHRMTTLEAQMAIVLQTVQVEPRTQPERKQQ